MPADSFVLHAPLELLARAVLLPLVHDRDREAARAPPRRGRPDRFEASGPGVEAARPPRADRFDIGARPRTARLADALRAGDLDGVDAAGGGWPMRRRAGAGGRTAAALAAPGAGLTGRRRAMRRSSSACSPGWPVGPAVTALPVRGLLRETGPPADLAAPAGSMRSARLARGRRPGRGAVGHGGPGDGGSDFIQPTMDRVDATGMAAERCWGPSPVGPATADAGWSCGWRPGRCSWTEPAAAPYGWTHCLTMPQAVMALADVVDPGRALRVAATEVLGFRAPSGTGPCPGARSGPMATGVPEPTRIPGWTRRCGSGRLGGGRRGVAQPGAGRRCGRRWHRLRPAARMPTW